MRKVNAVLGLGVLGVLSAAIVMAAKGPARESCSAPPPIKSGYVLHEWGTFTGFAGSDGVHIAFNQEPGADLPSFVKTRMSHAMDVDPQQAKMMLFLKWGGMAALQRMETPVMYFYSDVPKEIDVRVDIKQGTLTEFYPPVRAMTPKFGEAPGEPGARPATQPSDAARLNSSLDWGKIRIVPRPAGEEGKLIPQVLAENVHDHYAFARDTDSAIVQTADAKGTRHEEKFLFYRGLGNFTLPVTLAAKGEGRFELANADATPISTAFLLEVQQSGQVRFAKFDQIAGKRELELPKYGRSQSELAEAIEQALVAEGLYEKEARAMVATWRANWLAEPGTRVLYIVPRKVTDALLPLQITPAPDQSVRVLVGRIDVLTPEVERQIAGMASSVIHGGGGGAALTEQDVQLLTNLGRFRWPAMLRAMEAAGSKGEAADKDRRALEDAYSLRMREKAK